MAQVLDEDWKKARGIEIQSVGIASVSYDEESQKLINMRNQGAMMGDPTIREGFVQSSIAKGLEAAGSNANGAMAGYMGMGMGMQGAGGFMSAASNTNMQQMNQQAQYQQQMNQQQPQYHQQYGQQPQYQQQIPPQGQYGQQQPNQQYGQPQGGQQPSGDTWTWWPAEQSIPETSARIVEDAVLLQPPGPAPAVQSTPENSARTAGNLARKGGSLCQQLAINARTAEEN